MTDSSKKTWSRVPKDPVKAAEAKQKLSESLKRHYDENPESRKQRGDSIKAALAKPGVLESRGNKIRDARNTPESKKKASEHAKRLWSNPEHREKMRAIHQRRCQDLIVQGKTIMPRAPHKGTRIERAVAQMLGEMGVEFEEQVKIGPYRVDFFVRDANTIIEAYGCYYHNCPQCGLDRIGEKKTQADSRKLSSLKSAFNVLVLWEHEIVHGDVRGQLQDALILYREAHE